MKYQLPAILCLTFLFAANARAQLPVVADPLAAYFHDLVTEEMNCGVSVVEADFDCDGRLDVAITTSAQGHAGADCVIFILL